MGLFFLNYPKNLGIFLRSRFCCFLLQKKLKENRVVFFYSFTISLNGFQQTDLICGIVVHKNFENAELCAFFTSSAGSGDEGADGCLLIPALLTLLPLRCFRLGSFLTLHY